MKLLLITSSILFSLSTFAADHSLLLDATCKVTCFVQATEIPAEDQGNSIYESSYSHFYIDLMGLSREQIELKKEHDFSQICKNRFGKDAYQEKSDCLFFKH